MTWRFDNRKNPFLFRDIMLNLIASDNLQYKGTHLSRCLGIEHCCQSLISAAVITGFNLVSHKQYGTSPFMPSSPIQPAQRNTYIYSRCAITSLLLLLPTLQSSWTAGAPSICH